MENAQNPIRDIKQFFWRYVIVKGNGFNTDKPVYNFTLNDIYESERDAYAALSELLDSKGLLYHDYEWLYETLNDLFCEKNTHFQELFEKATKKLSSEELEPFGSLIYGYDWLGYGYYDSDGVLSQSQGTDIYLVDNYEVCVKEIPFTIDKDGNLNVDQNKVNGFISFS